MRFKGIGLIIILGTALYLFLHKSPAYHRGPVLNSTVIAFDYDGRHSAVTPQSLINGDALIFLKVDPNDNGLELVSSLKQLQDYDGKKKGYIALDNPNFKDYYFGRYLRYSDLLEYRQLSQLGIAGIALKYTGNKVTSAQVILLDNSRRYLMPVKITSDVLEHVKLKECDEQCDLPQ
ncbi:hypothetical protein [Legionella quateirensis]|uniref:Uncharacterized protein n=1 Tax=Legionella quateirensis TaxID=45072 RepID=A0A378KNC2_9GAMM|nr:hypothetical protein [Legionella quateirensis]KTD52866.1 hypothetical protein Lqua_0699 [Legionella quateirensis]STY16404.1 Uncharacterised protein [Legionella quateirensis]